MHSYTTCYNIPLYAFPLTAKNRQHLLNLSFSLKLGSDLPITVLLPDSHHHRLAVISTVMLLSSS